jgi:hypothetical protein
MIWLFLKAAGYMGVYCITDFNMENADILLLWHGSMNHCCKKLWPETGCFLLRHLTVTMRSCGSDIRRLLASRDLFCATSHHECGNFTRLSDKSQVFKHGFSTLSHLHSVDFTKQQRAQDKFLPCNEDCTLLLRGDRSCGCFEHHRCRKTWRSYFRTL